MITPLCLKFYAYFLNDFVDFAEEEIPPKPENIFLKKKDMLGLMKIKTQIINIGIEEDPNPDRLNIERREKKSKLFNLLKEHKDVFAWSYQNMPGINPDMVQRCIFPAPRCKTCGTKATQDPTWIDAQNQRGDNQIEMTEYPQWLANVIPIPNVC